MGTVTLILTPQQHADLRERLDRLYDYLEIQRNRQGWPDHAHNAVMDAAEALDLLDQAIRRTAEMAGEAAQWAWARALDCRVKH